MYYTRLFIFLFFLTGFSTNFLGQEFEYKEIENKYSKFIYPKNVEFVNLVKYLPEQYVKDASVDYTENVQKAINENNNVEFPNFPIKINDKGLNLKSDSNLFFNKNSSLVLAPSSKDKYSILNIENKKNISIYNPILIGDRDKHIGKTGEWGMGINIKNAKSIKIYNVDIRDTWGDGIYITSYSSKDPSNNILIQHGSIDNARRNGISIISGQNITIDRLQISNTNGHNPASGIDVEPNENTPKIIHNLIIKNLWTFNNDHDGIVLNLKNLIENNSHTRTSITIENHEDRYSRLGLLITHKKAIGQSLFGKIILKDLKYMDSKNRFPISLPEVKFAKRLPSVEFHGVKTNKVGRKEFNQKFRKEIENKNKIQYFSK